MYPLTAIAIFCEDIREEKNDMVTLIGIMGDTINVEGPPGYVEVAGALKVLPRVCIYMRFNFDPADDLSVPEIRLIQPDNSSIRIGEISSEVVDRAKSEAAAKGHILAGVISRVVIGSFQPQNGSIKVEADINGETRLMGALTINLR